MTIKIVQQGFTFADDIDYAFMVKKIERMGRICYQSEEKIKNDSAEAFIRRILARDMNLSLNISLSASSLPHPEELHTNWFAIVSHPSLRRAPDTAITRMGNLVEN